MPAPQTPYEAVLAAARDVTTVDTAFEAEMLGAALLGSVYAVAEDDRAGAVRRFVGAFLTATAKRRTATATTIRSVFATLVPDAPGAAAIRQPAVGPIWIGQLGRVRLTGSYSYGDIFGDQTSYLATFAYDDPAAGGPEHAVVTLIDHNIGIVKDIFVGGPAPSVVAQARELCESDDLTWFGEIPPERMHSEIDRHLDITDGLAELPDEGSVATDRAIAGARLSLLPGDGDGVAGDAELSADRRAELSRDFLDSPEAADLAGADPSSLHFAISLVLDHAETFPDVDPLRWSPAVVGLFLLDWVHRRAVLDADDAAILPRVLRAWVAYASRRRGLPAAATEQTVAAVDELAGEFARLYASGERRSPESAAVAQLIAEGVDLSDPTALNAWLQSNLDNGARPPRPTAS